MNKTAQVAKAFLSSESQAEVGSAEYSNKLETIRTILEANGKNIEHLQSYTPDALVPLLIDLVLTLESKAKTAQDLELPYEGAGYLNLDNPDIIAEIDQAYEDYATIDETGMGVLRLTYTNFFFEGRTQAQRYGIAQRLIDRCRNSGSTPEQLWLKLKAKGGLMDV